MKNNKAEFEFMAYWFYFCIIATIIMAIFFIIDTNKDAIASDKAQDYCLEHGFQSYFSFTRTIFSDKPLAIRCSEPLTQQQMNLNLNIDDKNGTFAK